MPNKSKLLAVGLLVAVATAGFAMGHTTATYASADVCARGRERWSFSGMLQDSLGLTDAQRDSVRAILNHHRAEMHALMEAVRPQMDSVRARVDGEITGLMTSDQQQRFTQLRDRWRASRAARAARRDSTAPGAAGRDH
jgi:Spy/CpxP family protein refolding chaperone